MTEECPFETAKKILDTTFPTIPSLYFNKDGDRCYCLNCHQQRKDCRIYSRGKPRKSYALPIGWARFGLKIDEAKCLFNKVWKDWHVAFHGTTKDIILKIFKLGLILLKSGDITIGGDTLNIHNGHIKTAFKRYNKYTGKQEIFDPNQIYISPSIQYSSHEVYAKWFYCKHPVNPNENIMVQFAFQLRIRPDSYCIGQETVGATKKGINLDDYFSNDELEWYTKEGTCIVLHGLLIRYKPCKYSFGLCLSSTKLVDDDDDKKNEMESEYKIIKRLKTEIQDLKGYKQSYLKITEQHTQLLQIFTKSMFERAANDDTEATKNEIARIYELYSSVPGAHAEIAVSMKRHIYRLGWEYIQKSNELNINECIQSLIGLHDRFLKIIKNQLQQTHAFHEALKESFEELMNTEDVTSALLARFANDVLKKDSKLLEKYGLEDAMDHIVMLYGYIHDKYIFERDYLQYLASRLLLNLSESEESERSMVGKLKAESGCDWLSKADDILTDIQKSKELMIDFHRKCNDIEIDLNVTICTWGSWPTSSHFGIKLPKDVIDISNRFKQFYFDVTGRKLLYQMDKGKAEVVVQFNANCTKILVVSTFQMIILLLFNNKDIWTFAELAVATMMPHKLLTVALLSMAHPKINIIKKVPYTKDVADAHTFQLNSKYSNCHAKIIVPTLRIKRSNVDNYADNYVDKYKMEAMYRLRRHQMDAMIVRIMKVRKHLNHNALIIEVKKYLRLLFIPKSIDIKRRIANLIILEYLERDENDRQLYHYKV